MTPSANTSENPMENPIENPMGTLTGGSSEASMRRSIGDSIRNPVSPPIRLAMVGCGQIARAHLAAVDELKDQVSLVWTVDSESDRARSAAEKHGAPRWGTDYKEAFASGEIDAAILCLPHHLHAPVAIAAAEAGVHVLCEKPMSLNHAEAQAMLAAADANKTALMIGHSRRFTPWAARARDIVTQGELGPLRHISFHLLTLIEKPSTPWRYSREQAGGFMIPIFGTHLIDLLTWVTDHGVRQVYCQTGANSVWEGEDEVAIILTLADQQGTTVPATVLMSTHCRFDPERRMARDELVIAGSEKTLTLKSRELRINGESVTCEGNLSNFGMQLQAFVDALREGRDPLSSGREAARIMEVLDACHESAAINAPVHVSWAR